MLLAAVWLLVVVDLLLGVPVLRTLAVGCLVAFLLSAVPRASVHIRVIFLIATAASGWSLLVAHEWAPVRRGLESGIIMGAFFPTIMLLRASADESPLIGATRERLAGFSDRQREMWVQAVAHLLGSFLMVGGYLIARAALPAEMPEARRIPLAETAVVGLGLAVLWSPFFVAGAIASQLVPTVSAWQLLLLGLGFALVGWALSFLLFYRGMGAAAVLPPLRGVATFAIPSAVLVAAVIAVSLATGLRSLEAIVLVVPLLCLGYLATLGWRRTARALGRVPRTLARLSDELIVFTAAMCLGAVVAGSGAGRELSQAIAGLAGVPLLLITSEVALIAGLGFAGVHPMITATLLLPLLVEAHRQIATLVVAFIVVFAWGLSSLAAIWTLPVASAATTFGVPVRRLAVGRNARFALVFGITGCFVLAMVNRALTS